MTGKEFEQIIRISFERKKVYELDNRQEAVPKLCARLLQKHSAPRQVSLLLKEKDRSCKALLWLLLRSFFFRGCATAPSCFSA